jgi:hypothetical protein
MIKKTSLLMALAFAAFSLPATSAAAQTPCDKTAEKMKLACHFGVADDFFATFASCKNLGDAEARDECREEAQETRAEDNANCYEVRIARREACDLLDEYRYDPDPLLSETYIDPDDIPAIYNPNPYVSLEAGHTYVLRAGEEGEETVVVHVTGDTREILGVQCRVIVDIVVETSEEGGEYEYEAVEVTDDWMAQTTGGDVVYCGEVARNYEDGVLRDLEGSFEAGLDYAKAGILFLADPVRGLAHRQEFAPGDAEDIVQYLALDTMPSADEGGDNERFPCYPDACVKAMEFAPLEPESSEYKYYRPGTGFVLAVALEDGEVTGEREELVCVGDSLDILGDPACEIGDSEGLLAELCKLSPEAFCPGD